MYDSIIWGPERKDFSQGQRDFQKFNLNSAITTKTTKTCYPWMKQRSRSRGNPSDKWRTKVGSDLLLKEWWSLGKAEKDNQKLPQVN